TAGQAAASSLAAKGAEAIAFPLDVGSEESVHRCLEVTKERFGRLDILVNNAGLRLNKPSLETTDDEWDRAVQINLYSAFLCSRVLAPVMLEGGGGAIVSISSMAAEAVFPRRPAYSAAKAGINALTRVLAVELAGG